MYNYKRPNTEIKSPWWFPEAEDEWSCQRLKVSSSKKELNFEICCTKGHLYLTITSCVFHSSEVSFSLNIIHREVDVCTMFFSDLTPSTFMKPHTISCEYNSYDFSINIIIKIYLSFCSDICFQWARIK